MKKVILVLLSLMIIACGTTTPTRDPNAIFTQVAETVMVSMTQTVAASAQTKTEPSTLIPADQPIEITREEKSPEVGPWTVQQSITLAGQYLVPEEMQPGQWTYKADDPTKMCSVATYSDLSGTSDSILDFFSSENKGFFVLNDNVRMVELNWKNCTWSRIGD